MGLFSLGVPRDAIREDQEGRGPEADENPEEFAMGADFKTHILAAGIIPDSNGCEDGSESQDKTEVTELFHRPLQ